MIISAIISWRSLSLIKLTTDKITMVAASDLNTYIGDHGRYQWQLFSTLCLFNLFMSHTIHIVFVAADMAHWCRVPELVDLPADVQKNVAIPTSVHSTVDHHDDSMIEYSSCEMFSLNYSVYNRTQFYSWNRNLMTSNNTPIVKCSQWTYDDSRFRSTIVKKVRLKYNPPALAYFRKFLSFTLCREKVIP